MSRLKQCFQTAFYILCGASQQCERRFFTICKGEGSCAIRRAVRNQLIVDKLTRS